MLCQEVRGPKGNKVNGGRENGKKWKGAEIFDEIAISSHRGASEYRLKGTESSPNGGRPLGQRLECKTCLGGL